MSLIKLEAGKFYRQRNGKIVGPLRFDDTSSIYPFDLGSSTFCWRSNGRWLNTLDHPHDLVEETPNPFGESHAHRPTSELSKALRDMEAAAQAEQQADAVNRPAHYTAGGVECIDAIQAAMTPEQFKGYLRGNALKYLWRHEHKGGIQDLRKAGWYLNKLVEHT